MQQSIFLRESISKPLKKGTMPQFVMYLILSPPSWKLLAIVLSGNIDWNNLFISQQELLE